jgi:hypothetical protein
MFNRLYVAAGIVTLVLYAAASLTGFELANPAREFVPADVRQSPGGYRSFHFWHSGYQGGK